jgi:L-ascorbate metabolism protein UlaG (beta-lactamase superfamily)
VTCELALTWWGHASATVEIAGVRVATDPVLADRVVHLRRHGPRPTPRAYDAGLVLLSHLHHDHLHLPTLRRLPPDAPLVVPRGGEGLLAGLGSGRVHPAVPGDVLELAGLRVTVLAATHDGRRGGVSRAVGPPLGFRVDGGGRSFWYPGDTALRDDLTGVGQVDLALVPIGGWGPTLPGERHLDPRTAAVAVGRVGATTAVPVHWGTFWPMGLRRLAAGRHQHLFETPGERFAAAMAASPTRTLVPRPGERVTL